MKRVRLAFCFLVVRTPPFADSGGLNVSVSGNSYSELFGDSRISGIGLTNDRIRYLIGMRRE